MSAPTPISFRCPSCGDAWPNTEAAHIGAFRSIVNQCVPKLCAACKADAPAPIVLDDVSFARFSRAIRNPPAPNDKLRTLFPQEVGPALERIPDMQRKAHEHVTAARPHQNVRPAHPPSGPSRAAWRAARRHRPTPPPTEGRP